MAIITTTATKMYAGGYEVAGYDPFGTGTKYYMVGRYSAYNLVMRYTFKTSSTDTDIGSIKITIPKIYWGVGTLSWSNTEFHISEDSTKYKNVCGDERPSGSVYHGNIVVSGDEDPRIGEATLDCATCQLEANKTYYLWLYPHTADTNVVYLGQYAWSATIETIPKASTVSATNASIGGSSTITINRVSTSYTHTLQYKCGSASGTIATNVGSSYTWSVPDSLKSQIQGSNKSVECTITCTTYNGTTALGSTSCTITLSVASSAMSPTVSVTYTKSNNSSLSTSSTVVQNIDSVACAITASAVSGATISSITIVNGSYNRVLTPNTASYSGTITIDPMNSKRIDITVKDSRGYTASSYKEYTTLINYNLPTVTATISAPTTTDGKITAAVSGSWSNITNNSIKIYYAYRVKGASTSLSYSYITPTTNGSKYSANITMPSSGTVSYRQSYEVYIYAKDSISQSDPVVYVTKTSPVFYWGKESFHFNVPVTFCDGQEFDVSSEPEYTDYVIASGNTTTNGVTWYYRKWNGGDYECYCKYSATGVNIAKNNYSGFYYSDQINLTLPITFKSAPVVHCFGGCSSYLTFATQVGAATTTIARFSIACLTSAATSVNINVDVSVRGRWK